MNEIDLFLLDLCSGAGGFHLAAQNAGLKFKQTFHSDINEYANKIYKARFPASIPLGDLRRIRGRDLPTGRYIICAGFPCQPFSVAGSGLGVGDDRYLWEEIMRIASEIIEAGSTIDFFVFENVAGIESVPFATSETRLEVRCGERPQNFNHQQELFEQIQKLQLAKCLDDLENAGASFQTFDIPAIGVNAWHRRKRIWIVGSFADSFGGSGQIRQTTVARKSKGFAGSDYQLAAADHSDTDDERQFGRLESGENGQRQIRARCGNDQSFGEPPIRDSRIGGNNTDSFRKRTRKSSKNNDARQSESGEKDSGHDSDADRNGLKNRRRKKSESDKERNTEHVRFATTKYHSIDNADADRRRCEKQCEPVETESEVTGDQFNSFDTADDQGVGQKESCLCQSCRIRQANRFNPHYQWQRHWVEVATELCRNDDGLRNELDIARLRNDIAGRYPNASEADIERAIDKLETSYRKSRIELMGNSIVPQIPTEFFKIIKLIYSGN